MSLRAFLINVRAVERQKRFRIRRRSERRSALAADFVFGKASYPLEYSIPHSSPLPQSNTSAAAAPKRRVDSLGQPAVRAPVPLPLSEARRRHGGE